jgi:small-conductance mechanosensitive channel
MVPKIIAWTNENWLDAAIAVSVSIAALAVMLWLRAVAERALEHIAQSAAWEEAVRILLDVKRVSTLWIALLSAYPGVRLAPAPERWRDGVASLLLTSLLLIAGVTGIRVLRRLATLVGKRAALPERAVRVAVSVLAGAAGAIVVLGVLHVWGAPAVPLLVILVLAALLSAVALRDLLPTVVASFQVASFRDYAEGDYLKLDSGQEGTVEEITWRDLVLRGVDGSRVRIPHPKLVRATVINYGRSFGRAKSPLVFHLRSHLRELTDFQAKNLRELADCLKAVPDGSVYYHTHQYLEEHQYLTPTPANGFSEWVGDALGNEAVAESLGAIDILEVPTLGSLRKRLVAVVEEAIRAGHDTRAAEPGRELRFLESITFITPCPFEANNLRELAGAIRRASVGTLYFHLFEARLLGGAEARYDLSMWLRRELDETELATSIAQLSPYDLTFEGLRAELLSRIEARLE